MGRGPVCGMTTRRTGTGGRAGAAQPAAVTAGAAAPTAGAAGARSTSAGGAIGSAGAGAVRPPAAGVAGAAGCAAGGATTTAGVSTAGATERDRRTAVQPEWCDRRTRDDRAGGRAARDGGAAAERRCWRPDGAAERCGAEPASGAGAAGARVRQAPRTAGGDRAGAATTRGGAEHYAVARGRDDGDCGARRRSSLGGGLGLLALEDGLERVAGLGDVLEVEASAWLHAGAGAHGLRLPPLEVGAYFLGFVVLDGAGVRLSGHADRFQRIQNRLALYFQFSCQIVNANFAHPSLFSSPARVSCSYQPRRCRKSLL